MGTLILSLPARVLARIYTLTYGSRDVDIEVDDSGALLTKGCKMLRICKSLRRSIVKSCEQQHLQLVHTVRSPQALRNFWKSTDPTANVTRFVLFTKLEGLELTDSEERGSSQGPNIEPLFNAWREAFRAAPAHLSLVYFDLTRDFRLDARGVARLIHNLSVILNHRTQGAARCRIIGCKTAQGQLYVERSTCNVIKSGVETASVKMDSHAEYLAGPPAAPPPTTGLDEDKPTLLIPSQTSAAPTTAAPSFTLLARRKRKVDDMS